jgi:TRAP-type mannitol/chloroaromatic compound transport system substrate-binding protein
MEASYMATMEVHGETAKQNADFKKVNDSMMDVTKNAYQWYQVAEYSYDNFMIRAMRG